MADLSSILQGTRGQGGVQGNPKQAVLMGISKELDRMYKKMHARGVPSYEIWEAVSRAREEKLQALPWYRKLRAEGEE